jgi:DNA invertase Pin-like site-specific DNA recombinase
MIERRYVAYYRVSTKQQGRSGLGIEGQQMAVQTYAATNPGEFVAELTEIESGRKKDRPILREALRLCRAYNAILLIASLDRLARSVTLISGLMEAGTEFVAIDFPEANRFTLHILAAVAEYELKLMSERLKAAFAAAKARGVKLGEHLREYRAYDPESLRAARAAQLDLATRRAMALAPLLAQLRDGGMSINAIARELTRMEIETPRKGLKWRSDTIRHLFRLSAMDMPTKNLRPQRSSASIRDATYRSF